MRLAACAFNAAEADYSDPGNERARVFTAAGSANETRAALRVAVAWSYCGEKDAEPALALLDRIAAILWRLTHRRAGGPPPLGRYQDLPFRTANGKFRASSQFF